MFSKLFGSSPPTPEPTASASPSSSSPSEATPSPLSSSSSSSAAAAEEHRLERPQRTYAEELALQNELYPAPEDVPKCSELFDVKMKCLMSFKEQGRSIFRTGTVDGCERLSDDFTWCWQTLSRVSEPEAKREAWVRRRAEWWTGRRLGASSEDVWDVRGADRLHDFPPRLTDVDDLKADMSVPRPDNGSQ